MIFEEQAYQKECINNIIALLDGFDFKRHNNLTECLKRFHKAHPQPKETLSNKPNIDILMETGTGKTFTYLNLIFELHKVYKQKKFIIFVPRKAILESVRQNIELTKDYFAKQYESRLKPYYYTDSKSLSTIICHYINNTDELSVLILTNSAIDKKDNILNKPHESLPNTNNVLQAIAELLPISIIDEPHLLKGKAFMEYFTTLNTLYFRFGATFPKEQDFTLSNMAYCLDSISAFQQYLVKQVRVHSLSTCDNGISLKSIEGRGKEKRASFSYFLNGMPKTETIRIGESLQALHHAELMQLEKDKAYFTHKDNSKQVITKNTGYTLGQDDVSELLERAIILHFEKERELFEKNIKALSLFFIPSIADFRGEAPYIKQEFERIYKEERAKILSQDISESYRAYLLKDMDSSGALRVHQGYFSGDAKLSSKEGSKQENQEAADIALILKDKEKLLSFTSPLRFIFSVWALQEGWDNPNIFTLTKLASSTDISTHQQVGRGLRLCVDNNGRRITHSLCNENDEDFYATNYVDVVVSSKELDFIERLQQEINEQSFIFNNETLSLDFLISVLQDHSKATCTLIYLEDNNFIKPSEDKNNGIYTILKPLDEIKDSIELQKILGDKFTPLLQALKPSSNKHKQVKNASKKDETIKIKPDLASDFKELWASINRDAHIVYKNINDKALAESIAAIFNDDSQTPIAQEKIHLEIKTFNAKDNIIITQDSKDLKPKDYATHFKRDIPAQLLAFAKDENIPLPFLLQIYNQLDHAKFARSPKTAFSKLKNIIKAELHSQLLQQVSYNFTQNTFSPSYANLIEDNELKSSVKKSALGHYTSSDKPAASYLYEKIVYDSKIELDIATEQIEKVDSKTIRVFAKLPRLKIPTPYHYYEPDFAYFLENENGKKIFFVCETKGYDDEAQIPEDERKKIDYAQKFFTQLQEQVKDKNIEIIFNTRINKQSLLESLRQALNPTNPTTKDS